MGMSVCSHLHGITDVDELIKMDKKDLKLTASKLMMEISQHEKAITDSDDDENY